MTTPHTMFKCIPCARLTGHDYSKTTSVAKYAAAMRAVSMNANMY